MPMLWLTIQAYGDFILNRTPTYIQKRPKDYPSNLPWPGNVEIVDSLATLSRLRYPPYISPILFPNATDPLPLALSSISPIASSAHPSIRSTSCAIIHPNEPSCLRSYLTCCLQTFPIYARYFTLIFALFSLPRYKSFKSDPAKELNRLLKSILRSTMFVSGSTGTVWAAICLFQSILPRNFLSTKRWFLGGFVSGLWAFVDRKNGRSQFLYSFRISLDSIWKLGIKKRWWKGDKNVDVWVIVMSLMVFNSIHDLNPDAITPGLLRKTLASMKGKVAASKPKSESAEPESKNIPRP